MLWIAAFMLGLLGVGNAYDISDKYTKGQHVEAGQIWLSAICILAAVILLIASKWLDED